VVRASRGRGGDAINGAAPWPEPSLLILAARTGPGGKPALSAMAVTHRAIAFSAGLIWFAWPSLSFFPRAEGGGEPGFSSGPSRPSARKACQGVCRSRSLGRVYRALVAKARFVDASRGGRGSAISMLGRRLVVLFRDQFVTAKQFRFTASGGEPDGAFIVPRH
jgi:hypothetical protein